MREVGLRLFFILLLVSAYAYGSEAKGYKIVLASFPTFAEAKAALESVGTNIGEKEHSLQVQYRFEVVARPSGKAFMLAVEPIETQKDADTVAKQFKRLYPDAYVNGYFGPTKGSIFLKPIAKVENTAADITVKSNITAEANMTKVPVAVKNKAIAPVAENVIDAKPPINSPDTPKSNLIFYISALGIAVVGYVVFRTRSRKRVSASAEAEAEHLPEDLVEMIEAEAETDEDESALEPEITVSTPKVFEPERDIFYKLKKNIFFMTLLGELKEASDAKDGARCQDLIDEMMRYQKNFRQSVIITSMKELIENKMYDRLSELISKETV